MSEPPANETESTQPSAPDVSAADTRTAGRRVVFAIYTASISTAAVFGFALGFVLDAQNGPSVGSFGPITFPLTPLNLALFGIIVVGILLTTGLLLVRGASRLEA